MTMEHKDIKASQNDSRRSVFKLNTAHVGHQFHASRMLDAAKLKEIIWSRLVCVFTLIYT